MSSSAPAARRSLDFGVSAPAQFPTDSDASAAATNLGSFDFAGAVLAASSNVDVITRPHTPVTSDWARNMSPTAFFVSSTPPVPSNWGIPDNEDWKTASQKRTTSTPRSFVLKQQSLRGKLVDLHKEINEFKACFDKLVSDEQRATIEEMSKTIRAKQAQPDPTVASMANKQAQADPTYVSMAEEQARVAAQAVLEVAGYGRVFKLLGKHTQAVFFFIFTVAALSLSGLALAHLVRWQTGNVGTVVAVLSAVGGSILKEICRKSTSRKLAWALTAIIIYYSDAFKGTPNRELYDSIREGLALENVTMLHIASALAHNHRCYESNFTMWSCGHVKGNTEYLAPIIAKVFGSPHIWSNELNGATNVNLSYTGGRKITTQLYILRGAMLTDRFRSGFSYLSQVLGVSAVETVPPEITDLSELDRTFLSLAYVELYSIRTAAERQKALEKDMGFNRLVDSAGVFAGFMTLVVHDASFWKTVNFGSDFFEGAFTFYRNVFPPEHELVLQEGLDMCKIVPCLGGKPDFALPPPESLVKYVAKDVNTTVKVEPKVTIEPPKECPAPVEDNSAGTFIAGVISGVAGVAIPALAFAAFFAPEVNEFDL